MFAKVRGTYSIPVKLRYNLKKVLIGKAECIYAGNFLKDLDQMSEKDKLNRFVQRTSLNDRAEKNGVSIAVGFKPTEELSTARMIMLARHYMKGIGFEDQPYLVYRHTDVSQPHFHIVSTTIRANGDRIDLRPIIFHTSREVTQSMEVEFGLQKLERAEKQRESFKVKQAQTVVYGESPTQRAISDVLNTVVDHYKYTSLKELNAALREYNVIAWRGKETSQLYKSRGILYQVLDERGHRIGSPIKASRFFLNPTLDNLEKRFKLNEELRHEHRERITTAIEWAFAGKAPDWPGFQRSMEREGINIVVQEGKDGKDADVFFIDHREKSVVSGESLGDRWSLGALQARCARQEQLQQEEIQRQQIRIRL
ncbi:relaxase/mobilization nuclease domain-containing protein [Flavitalea sp. BT771]|uniref:relaxase/mobilization nuclease domain-containing protein n=1 Tax=Flavitalea sp. BT771 TaxID=3063329 RepID=UPI0026E2C80D|nr:relaxase/mobilization nuclease domain-containing protein [Flavitalea sp. BT771]MDO6433277.1 relaxase/mobilization nuclease domain-containing protein [Flavitalea sp. BT771]MDV6222818.1 relaxase/mobilization nuclease domain-containing protein [Flavitalea sp. BT771]